MRNFFMRKNSSDENLSKQISQRIFASLVQHVYDQTNVAMGASLFCAIIVFIGLYSPNSTNTALFAWFNFYFVITLSRIILVYFYKHDKQHLQRTKLWSDLYVVGSVLAGISWGLGAILLLPGASGPQQTLLILMIAGVTAGSLPLASAIPSATIGFLIFTLVPFIVVIAFSRDYIYLLFDVAVTLYLIYSIVVVLKASRLIRNSIELQFENAILLKNLSEAKLQLEVTNEKLELAATHDPLTQIANRRLFQTNLEVAIKRAAAKKIKLALLFIDLDLFKPVNDVYGHDIGDKVLVELIERLKSFFKSDTMIARLGGDEITVIIENVITVDEVKDIAKQLCRLLSTPIEINTIKLKISASIGISIYPDNGLDVVTLLSRADKAMYYAKEHGGNNFCFSNEAREFHS